MRPFYTCQLASQGGGNDRVKVQKVWRVFRHDITKQTRYRGSQPHHFDTVEHCYWSRRGQPPATPHSRVASTLIDSACPAACRVPRPQLTRLLKS